MFIPLKFADQNLNVFSQSGCEFFMSSFHYVHHYALLYALLPYGMYDEHQNEIQMAYSKEHDH